MSDILKETALTLLSRLQCEAEVAVKEIKSDRRVSYEVAITSPNDSKQLIGQHGANLQSLQHMLRILVSAQTNKPCFASIDVNGYRAERQEKIVRMAQEGADKAVRTDSMVILRPMTSFERRIVHMALQGNQAIATESLGRDPNRRVVIKPTRAAKPANQFANRGFTLDDIRV